MNVQISSIHPALVQALETTSPSAPTPVSAPITHFGDIRFSPAPAAGRTGQLTSSIAQPQPLITHPQPVALAVPIYVILPATPASIRHSLSSILSPQALVNFPYDHVANLGDSLTQAFPTLPLGTPVHAVAWAASGAAFVKALSDPDATLIDKGLQGGTFGLRTASGILSVVPVSLPAVGSIAPLVTTAGLFFTIGSEAYAIYRDLNKHEAHEPAPAVTAPGAAPTGYLFLHAQIAQQPHEQS